VGYHYAYPSHYAYPYHYGYYGYPYHYAYPYWGFSYYSYPGYPYYSGYYYPAYGYATATSPVPYVQTSANGYPSTTPETPAGQPGSGDQVAPPRLELPSREPPEALPQQDSTAPGQVAPQAAPPESHQHGSTKGGAQS
jgi:hypothetical protein